MNKIAVAIQINDKKFILIAQWPSLNTVRHRARRKMVNIKRGIRDQLIVIAAAIIPLPRVAAA